MYGLNRNNIDIDSSLIWQIESVRGHYLIQFFTKLRGNREATDKSEARVVEAEEEAAIDRADTPMPI